jgi:two-component system nitrogen regulation sensor histidine kinase NtrY
MNLEWEEKAKRRKEFFLIFFLSILFVILTAIEFKLFGMSRSLPFMHSIFFLGLVNFNIILFLLLFFLIFRNVVKIFTERESGHGGGTLKGKLTAAFIIFSVVPTSLMFVVSVFYINNVFDRWFSEKTAGILKSSMEVTNAFYLTAKQKNYHFAGMAAKELAHLPRTRIRPYLERFQKDLSLDVIEYYPGVLEPPVQVVAPGLPFHHVPSVSLELLEKGLADDSESSSIHPFEAGDLVRAMTPVKGTKGAVVVSSYVPLSLTSKMKDVATVYEDFRESNPMEAPIKSIYLILLVLMALTIVLGATWFGFYLARQLSVPLEQLGLAAKRVANRHYDKVAIESASREINELVGHFNEMTGHLETSEKNLRETLGRLNEHSKYMEVVLSTVTTGVISLDQTEKINMVNTHAAKLLEVRPGRMVGRSLKEMLKPEYYQTFESMISQMKSHKVDSLTREFRVEVRGRSIPLQMTLSLLFDDQGSEIGQVIVFDDLTPILSAQRAAAWTEVARRIAHEIKNPLTPIKLSAERLQKKFGAQIEDTAFADSIRTIIDQVDGLKNLVNEFNQFARLPRSQPAPGNLNQILSDVIMLFKNAHRDVTFQVQLDPQVPPFSFDADQIRRVMTNLLDNAVSAVRSEGEKGADYQGKITVNSSFNAELQMVRIEVEDNGGGIPLSMKDRLFEPYVTTKSGGTGLGLAISRRMVEDHHGFMRAFSDNHSFTRFVIELPAVSPGQARPNQEREE